MALADAEFVQGSELTDDFGTVVCRIVYTSEGTAHWFPPTFSKMDIHWELKRLGYSTHRAEQGDIPDIDWGICVSLTEDNGRV